MQVLLRLKALVDALIAATITEHFEIARGAAEHFWRPCEPVVLLSGPVATATPRHGQDGNLPCVVAELPDAPGTKAFLGAIDTLKTAAAGEPFVQTQSGSPWQPILLEWGVAVSALETGRVASPAVNNTLAYAPTFLSGTFQLQQNQPDFSRPDSLPLLERDVYEGRCVITPAAGTQLGNNLSRFLIGTTLDDCRERSADGEADYVNRLIAWYRVKHDLKPPDRDAEKARWLKLQRPFVDPAGKDDSGNPRLLPVKDILAWYFNKPVEGAHATVGNSWDAATRARIRSSAPFGACLNWQGCRCCRRRSAASTRRS